MSVDEIKKLAKQLKDKRDLKKALEDELKDLTDEIKEIEEHSLNDLLLDEGLTEIKAGDIDIKRSEIYRGKTSSTNKNDFSYLFESNNGGAVKQEIVIDIAGREDEIEDILDKAGIYYTKKYSIHHATLSSIIRVMVEEGIFSSEDIDKYNIYIQPKITVK